LNPGSGLKNRATFLCPDDIGKMPFNSLNPYNAGIRNNLKEVVLKENDTSKSYSQKDGFIFIKNSKLEDEDV
jgi:hypothetical protein